ncbi:hypothetical protein [Nonomuraea salmonea]|uniref:hypothetical protein n=1 Tax=Nonomuraea salmonea TaxID=46181 RepID=UPI002FEA7613
MSAAPHFIWGGRQADFAAAAREYGVPESVLLAVSYLESRWDANGGRPSTAGGYGPMHLVDAFPAGVHEHLGDAHGDPRGDETRPMTPAHAHAALRVSDAQQQTTLPEAGRLAGLPPERLRDDPAANIRAGAALLASYQDEPSSDPADWHGAVAKYAGTDDPKAAGAFADEVFSVMREGRGGVPTTGTWWSSTPCPTSGPGTLTRSPTPATPTTSPGTTTSPGPTSRSSRARPRATRLGGREGRVPRLAAL